MLRFEGALFPQEVILVCVRWHVIQPLNHRNINEMTPETSVAVDR